MTGAVQHTAYEIVNTDGLAFTWQNYVDLNADVKPWLQFKRNDTTHDTVLQLLTDAICQFAQKKLGQPIAPTTFYRRFNGWANWNGAYIMLPYFPVLEIVQVAEYWGVAGPHVLYESTPTDQVDGFQCDYQTGMLTRVFPGNVQKPWFPGSMNIEVRWTAGYNPIPADLKVATLEDIKEWWINTQQQSANRIGGATAANEFDSEEEGGTWMGMPSRVAAIIETYMQVGIG
jgi:hypothetical protein